MSENKASSSQASSSDDAATEESYPSLHIHMAAPMPGLESHTDYDLTAMDETGILWTLRSQSNQDVRLFAVPPAAFFDGYEPQIPRSALERLGIEDDNPFILVIVHPATGPYPHTANLLAPLVINGDTMEAMQVVLEDQDWPLQAPIGDPKE